MLAWGVLSVMQALLLPGLAVACRLGGLRWMDRVLIAVPLSLILNYFFVLALVLIGAYTRSALVAVVVIELAALGLMAVAGLRARPVGHMQSRTRSGTLQLADAAIAMLVTASLVPFAYVAYVQGGTVFTLWDAVVSWNRWALIWHNGSVPRDSLTYPQALPVLYSMTYKFIGDTEVQFFAKAIAVAYPLIAIVTTGRIASLRGFAHGRILLLSIPIFIWLAGQQYSGLIFVFGGYVDATIAYFALLAVYLFALLHQRWAVDRARFWDDSLVYASLMVIAGGAIVKQTGGFLAILFPLALWAYLGRNGVPFWRMPKVWACAVAYAFVVGHWYIFKFIQFHAGIDTAGAAAYSALIPGPILMRPVRAAGMFFDAVGWWWAPAFVVGLFHPVARRIAAWGVLPLFLVWAFTVSYDLRGLFIALPWIALVMAAGCALLVQWALVSPFVALIGIAWLAALGWQVTGKAPALLLHISQGIPIQFFYSALMALVAISCAALVAKASFRNAGWKVLAAAAVLLVVAVVVVDRSSGDLSARLRAASLAQQQQLGNPELNAFLLDYFSRTPPSTGDVATSYQYLGFVPGLKDHYRYAPCKYDKAVFDDPTVRYFLTSLACPWADTVDTISRLGEARKLRVGSGYEFYELHPGQAGAAPATVDAASPARALVANNYSGAVWKNGVRIDRGNTDMFFFLADSAADNPVKVGTRLGFAGAGVAVVKEVAVSPQGGRLAVFVRVDRTLQPDRDGFPNPIVVR